MKNIYVGVDPSINSTGVVIRIVEGDKKDTHFYIIKCNSHLLKKNGEEKNPLTKAEQKAQKANDNFDYILYDKWYGNDDKSSYEREMLKTVSLGNICDALANICAETYNSNTPCKMYACIEGISYGSSGKTTAIFDLAGLNYLMRKTLMYHCDTLTIAPPGHVKKFATGNGSADKDAMITVFDAICPGLDIPKKDDIADAYFMSMIAEEENKRG